MITRTPDEMIAIKIKNYNYLKNRDLLLECLEAQGVDNWIGWDDAIDDFNEQVLK